jgi:hypothetical protein
LAAGIEFAMNGRRSRRALAAVAAAAVVAAVVYCALQLHATRLSSIAAPTGDHM